MGSVDGFGTLPSMGLVSAEWQGKSFAEVADRHALETVEDGLCGNIAARNQPIAVIAICQGEDRPVLHGIPKGVIAQGLQPFFQLFNILKHNHSHIIPQRCFVTQFYQMKESTA